MRMKRVFKYLMLVLIIFVSCEDNDGNDETIVRVDPVSGGRIAWDYSSLQRLVPLSGNSIAYSSYPRMIELANGDFICAYEADGNIDIIRSTDKGATWTQPVRIATFSNNTIMAVPEIVQLSNGDIIISYNPRPLEPYTQDRHFAIALKISKDNGFSWGSESVIYEAGTTFDVGCWEPNIVELANGELQLFFANEADYTLSHEQNISMFRSSDKGESWGEREIVSFSPTSRDGMPVVLYLEGSDEIIMAIEDNYQYNFKPTIIRTSDNWANAPVGRTVPDRSYALNHDQRTPTYQGAPYIRKMPSGNIVLGYQGTDGERNHDMSNARLRVEVGDKYGMNFSNNTEPFNVPTGKYGLWNSVSVMDGKVWGLTATNAFSDKSEIWTIAGYEIVDNYIIPSGSTPPALGQYPFFVGHKFSTNAGVRMSSDNSNLYLKAIVEDDAVYDSDGVTFYIDVANVSSDAPVSGVYSFTINADGSITSMKGYNGNWEGMDFLPEELSVDETASGYEIELAISWDKLGGIPEADERIGFSVALTDYSNSSNYTENLTMSDSNKPYTWVTIRL